MKFKKNYLYCFSPEVMIGTFLIEIILAIYVFLRYKANSFTRTAIAILVLLATFQLAEYQICKTEHMLLWSRIGFIAITLLPLAGLYLIRFVTGKRHFLEIGIVSAASFILFFLMAPTQINNAICGGNYIIFDAIPSSYLLYSIYYFTFLGIAISEAIEKIRETKKGDPKRYLLFYIIIGYLSFMAPMLITYLLYPETEMGIPSIMCGFAIIFAIIITFKIVPNYFKAKVTISSK